jgi:chemotaxis signal transduction protein
LDPQARATGTPLLAALAHAGAGAEQGGHAAEVELFRMTVGGTRVAVEAGLVYEVVRIPPITPLPGAPALLSGVASHRGDVVAVVDLARLLGKGETKIGSRSRMALARSDGLVVAVLADEVLGLAKFPAKALQPAPLGTESSEFISGLLMEGAGSTNILDLRRALASARERASSRK